MLFLMLMVGSVVCVVSCKDDDDDSGSSSSNDKRLVGTWSYYEYSGSNSYRQIFTFKSDGSGSFDETEYRNNIIIERHQCPIKWTTKDNKTLTCIFLYDEEVEKETYKYTVSKDCLTLDGDSEYMKQ